MASPPFPPLNWLRAFEAAARYLSFTEAGRDLGVSQSAISQNVRLLEARLGQPLFERLPQGLELTEPGKAYLPAVQDAFDRISAGTREVFGPVDGERVTLRVTPGFAECWLLPRLPLLFAALPDVQIRVTSTIWATEFDAVGADVEIRYGDGDWPGLASEKLTVDRIFPVASPDVGAVLERDPSSLARYQLLHTIGFRVTWPTWLDAAGLSHVVDAGSGHQFDTAILPIQLAERGCGVALARSSLVADKLAAGSLVAPLAPALETDQTFYLVRRSDAPPGTQAQQVIEWLQQAADVSVSEDASPLP